MRKLLRIVTIAVFFCVFSLFFTMGMSFAVAESDKYFDIYAENLTFVSEGEVGSSYQITLAYYDKDGRTLPQANYTTYATKNLPISTDDTDTVNMRSVQGGGSKTKISFNFSLTETNGCKGFLDAEVQSFVLPDKLIVENNANYQTEYTALRFLGDIQIVKIGDGWEVVAVPVPPSYEMKLSKESVRSFGWNESENALVALVSLPFAYSENALYEGAIEVEVIGADYAGEITLKHIAESTLMIVMGDSTHLKVAKNISVSLKSGYIEHERIGDITITGEITYYGYTDETWFTERYYEIFKTIENELVLEKIPVTETEYNLTEPNALRGRICVGWKENGVLYPIGKALPLIADLYIEAQFLSYGINDGASIRYAETAEDNSGIRFNATLDKAGFDTHGSYIRGFGIIVMPLDMIEEGKEFILENYNGEGQARSAYIENAEIAFDKQGKFTLTATIVKVLKSNYNRPFAARAYTVFNYGEGSVYLWDSFIETRSVYEVASNALEKYTETPSLFNENQLKILKGYVNGVANIVYENGEARVVSVLDSPIITGVSVSVDGAIVTLRLQTEVTYFGAVTYNGIRIKNSEQTHENGVLTVKFKHE